MTTTPARRPDPTTTAAIDGALGQVEGIFIAAAAGAPMQSVRQVLAIAGVGLEGDRYATRVGTYSDNHRVDREVTLIESEQVEALAASAGIVLGAGEIRRNVTTRGIRLNDLVGRRFRIGSVVCEGTRLCEPCQYLADMLAQPILAPLVHRAGLRARILSGGEIGLGAEVVALD